MKIDYSMFPSKFRETSVQLDCLESYLPKFNPSEEGAYENTLAPVIEGKVINAETRKRLPDDAFGLPKQRLYPLIVASNPVATNELIGKAVQFFHFAKPDNKKELATNIVKALKKTQSSVKISKKSQILKYVDVPEKYLTSAPVPKPTDDIKSATEATLNDTAPTLVDMQELGKELINTNTIVVNAIMMREKDASKIMNAIRMSANVVKQVRLFAKNNSIPRDDREYGLKMMEAHTMRCKADLKFAIYRIGDPNITRSTQPILTAYGGLNKTIMGLL